MRTIDLFSVKKKMTKIDLINAIKNAKGRTILSQLFITKEAILYNVSNIETARAFGADLISLNDVDLNNLKFPGIDKTFKSIDELKVYTPSPIGINLYVISKGGNAWPTKGHEASIANLEKVVCCDGMSHIEI